MKESKKEQLRHSYSISGMHCGGCAGTVERKLAELSEVKSVKVDLVRKQAEIISDVPVSLNTLQEALTNTSYAIAEPNTGG